MTGISIFLIRLLHRLRSVSVMGNYKIAVIVAGIDETYQSTILRGIQSAAPECGLDFYIFASFTGVMDNASHDAGELNIFDLPDFSDFDGAVLLTNTIEYQPVVSNILNRIYDAGIPAVSIDNDLEKLLHIGIDNRTAMREITEHFIVKHGFTKFNYISGPADNPESAVRLRAFLDVLSEHNIQIDENRIYYGDFRGPSGKAAVESFLRNTPFMPEAIICANDVMAAAAVNRLYEAGYMVPSQIAVSGFDNTYGDHNLRIDLTTVERPLAASGKLACKMLRNHFNGVEQERSRILNMSTRFSESCGCHIDTQRESIDYKELNIANYSRLENMNFYLTQFNKLSRNLQSCGDFDEYIGVLKKFVEWMNPEEFYFCVCDSWNGEFVDDRGVIQKDEKIITEYSEEVYVPIAYSSGRFYDDVVILSKSLIPSLAKDDKPGKFYYFLPLHFGERCLGYMVINNCRVSLHHAMFQAWCITINNSLENIRKLMCLDYAVKKLGNLYARDSFTGIFNRNGFVQATADDFRRCAAERRNVMLMFIDLDGLKVINDSYGHDIGDIAIHSIANVLVKSCTGGEVYCRFGGDEFIVFAADYDDIDAQLLTKRIEENIAGFNAEKNNSFVLSASTGYVIAVPKRDEDLFRFVTDADKVMYEQKRKKKRSHYLKSE